MRPRASCPNDRLPRTPSAQQSAISKNTPFLKRAPLPALPVPCHLWTLRSVREQRSKEKGENADEDDDGFHKSRIFFAEVGSESDSPEEPDKKRPISGNQQIQVGTKHNFHGLKSVNSILAVRLISSFVLDMQV